MGEAAVKGRWARPNHAIESFTAGCARLSGGRLVQSAPASTTAATPFLSEEGLGELYPGVQEGLQG
ncbi:MAG: hypothetical protein K0Q72_1056 [Armatimonadetes bacterium]|jgi:hypothetical protein|nr:hypothetical protein [Armatimonadota bacterium]